MTSSSQNGDGFAKSRLRSPTDHHSHVVLMLSATELRF